MDSMREIGNEKSGVAAQSQPLRTIAQALRKHWLKLIRVCRDTEFIIWMVAIWMQIQHVCMPLYYLLTSMNTRSFSFYLRALETRYNTWEFYERSNL